MKTLNKEIFKDILGYEGFYQVSNFGRVKSLNRKVIKRNGRVYYYIGQTLKLREDKDKYHVVSLKKINEKQKLCRVNRVVAQAFIPNPNNYPQVNHKDGKKQNNYMDNLEWCTRSMNIKHSYKMGMHCGKKISGEKHGLAKLKNEEVEEIKKSLKNYKYGMVVELAKKYNIHPNTITNIKRGHRWQWLKV